jgi:la-related protein 1
MWCEAARIFMRQLRWSNAERCLQFAVHFTPQYGDSFVELLRLHYLRPVDSGAELDLAQISHLCANAEPSYGALWSICRRQPLYSTQQVLQEARDMVIGNHPMLNLESSTAQYDLGMLRDPAQKFSAIFGSGEFQKIR